MRFYLIDGEVVCSEVRGLARFDVLRRHDNEATAFLCAFDLLDGTELRRGPTETRKATLAKISARAAAMCGSTTTSNTPKVSLSFSTPADEPGRHHFQAPKFALLFRPATGGLI